MGFIAMNGDPENAARGKRNLLRPVDWTLQAGAVGDVLHSMERSLRRRRRRRRAAWSCAAVVLLMALVWTPWRRAAATPTSVVVVAPAREILPDRTVVELRPGAKIVTEYSPSLRRVVLLQGQAHFQVTKDAQRPFVVVAGGIQVRAVGTAFAIESTAQSIDVLVTEGRVAVEPTVPAASDTSTEKAVAYLDAGHNARVELPQTAAPLPAAEITAVASAQISERLAWRVPRLELSGTPLVDVLALMREHRQEQVRFTDETIGRLRVSGFIRADNMENLWLLLKEQHGIKSEQLSGAIVLSR